MCGSAGVISGIFAEGRARRPRPARRRSAASGRRRGSSPPPVRAARGSRARTAPRSRPGPRPGPGDIERPVRAGPLPVLRERLALERSIGRVVEVAQDDPRYLPVTQRQVCGLARAAELGHDAEVDRFALEAVVEPAGLLLSLLSQPDDDGGIAVDEARAEYSLSPWRTKIARSISVPSGSSAPPPGCEQQARLGRRERPYLNGMDATEDDAWRSLIVRRR